MKIEQIAELCHEVNKAYCEALGDFSQKHWHGAEEWQRESAINGVEFILQNPNSSPSANHENWLKTKLADGWKYGSVKDPENKLHPCILPFDDLPVPQKAKDHIFRAIVETIAAFSLVPRSGPPLWRATWLRGKLTKAPSMAEGVNSAKS